MIGSFFARGVKESNADPLQVVNLTQIKRQCAGMVDQNEYMPGDSLVRLMTMRRPQHRNRVVTSSSKKQSLSLQLIPWSDVQGRVLTVALAQALDSSDEELAM